MFVGTAGVGLAFKLARHPRRALAAGTAAGRGGGKGGLLLQLNRNVLVCFAVSATVSAATAHVLGDGGVASHVNTTATMAVGYAAYFGLFAILFYASGRGRRRGPGGVKREIAAVATSFGLGEVVYLVARWPSMYHLLEAGVEPSVASIASEALSTACYMAFVTAFLRGTRTY